MARQFTISLVMLLIATFFSTIGAFVVNHRHDFAGLMKTTSSSLSSPTTTYTQVWMAEEDDASAEGEGEEASAEGEEASAEEEEAVEEEEEEPEDPEITALKEQIAELETTLKSKISSLRYTQEQAEEYTKGGYARKVAEMENMRRTRNSLNQSSRGSATANVLAQFLPIYDTMNALKEEYANDEFGSKYGGLSMTTLFNKLGVKEYTVTVGEPIDPFRMNVLEKEYSNDIEVNTVLRPISIGMELEGNIMRTAECVASLGSEEDAIKAKEEEEAAAAAEAEAKAAEEEETEETTSEE